MSGVIRTLVFENGRGKTSLRVRTSELANYDSSGHEREQPILPPVSAAEEVARCRVVFIGKDLTVAYYPRLASEPKGYAVTFDYLNEDPLLRSPYLFKVVERLGLDQIHIFNSWSHWYQTPEFEYLSEIIASIKGPSRPELIMGSSMGGYGALKANPLLNPLCTIAFCPQTFIDPELDQRFLQWWKNLYVEQLDRGNGLINLVFDPGNGLDKQHAARLGSRVAVRLIPLRSHSHWIDHAFSQKNLLFELISELTASKLDTTKINILRRDGRRLSSRYKTALQEYIDLRRSR